MFVRIGADRVQYMECELNRESDGTRYMDMTASVSTLDVLPPSLTSFS